MRKVAKRIKVIPDGLSKTFFLQAVMVLLGMGVLVGAGVAYAETYPGGADNGKTSRIKQASSDLATLGYGSTSNTPDWGADWNRIITAGKWTPQGDIAPNDVRAGKKFYNGNRTEQTGTAGMVGACPTQVWHDIVAQPNATPATKQQAMLNNCATDWTVASPSKPGDDKKDPVTGLTWSQCLRNNTSTIEFTASGCGNFSWDSSFANNTVKTASELCSERGNGWRLPTEKELLQAYIDGSYFSLSSPSATFWSATQPASTHAWYVSLHSGATNTDVTSGRAWVRCLR